MLKKQVREEKFIKTNWREDEKNIITTGFMFKHKYGAWTRV